MKKILITGCHRSGTSLLQALMKYFEDTYVYPSELHPFEPIRKEENKPVIVRKMPQGKFYPRHYMPRKLRNRGDFEDANKQIRTIEDLIEDDWKIIYLIRDGRDVLVSKHGVNKNKYWSIPWKWTKSIENALPLIKGYNRSFLPIYYEKLVIQPRMVMNNISEFIDKDYSDFSNFYKNINPQSEMGKAMKKVRPIDKNSIGNWKKSEHTNRMKSILQSEDGSIFCELLVDLGYEVNRNWTQLYAK